MKKMNHLTPSVMQTVALLCMMMMMLLPCLAVAASSDANIALCPVIRYSSDVEELPLPHLSQLPLTALESQFLPAVAAGTKKAYTIVFHPISYAHNSSTPKVDWVDLHYKIGSAGVQENVKMKSHPSSLPLVSLPTVTAQPQMDANMMSSTRLDSALPSIDMDTTHLRQSSIEFVFSPIFLSPSDQLFYSHTICSNMIDCESETHVFTPLQSTQLTQQQPVMQSIQLDQPSLKSSAPQPQNPSESTAAIVCPAIQYTSRVHCTDFSCKLSFINLSPNRSVDWVDVHVVSNSSSFANAVGQSSLSVSQMVRENFRMAHVGGAVSTHVHIITATEMAQSAFMVAELTSSSSLTAFGAESAPESLLNATGGSQVFQFTVPLGFRNGDMIGISYTYCAQGTDCDTEVQMYKLKAELSQSSIINKQSLNSNQMTGSKGDTSSSHQLLQQTLPIQVPAGYTIRITHNDQSTIIVPPDNAQHPSQIKQTELQHVQL